jgi:hypothetical protein
MPRAPSFWVALVASLALAAHGLAPLGSSALGVRRGSAARPPLRRAALAATTAAPAATSASESVTKPKGASNAWEVRGVGVGPTENSWPAVGVVLGCLSPGWYSLRESFRLLKTHKPWGAWHSRRGSAVVVIELARSSLAHSTLCTAPTLYFVLKVLPFLCYLSFGSFLI